MKHSASIHFLWAELPAHERAIKAAANGFDYIELWDWRTQDMNLLYDTCCEHNIVINGFFGHSSGGLRDPRQRTELLDNVGESIEVAERVGANQLHMFSDGIRRPQGEITKPPPITKIEQHQSCIEGIQEAVKLIEGKPFELILEAINNVHVPGYYWQDSCMQIEMCMAVDHPQVKLAFDCFHQQLVAGRLTENLIAAIPYAGRIDIANVPGRHQPGVGEIDFHHIYKVVKAQGYDGVITYETDPLDGDNAACVKVLREIFEF